MTKNCTSFESNSTQTNIPINYTYIEHLSHFFFKFSVHYSGLYHFDIPFLLRFMQHIFAKEHTNHVFCCCFTFHYGWSSVFLFFSSIVVMVSLFCFIIPHHTLTFTNTEILNGSHRNLEGKETKTNWNNRGHNPCEFPMTDKFVITSDVLTSIHVLYSIVLLSTVANVSDN